MGVATCQQCGDRFTAERITAKFCCGNCKMTFHRDKGPPDSPKRELRLPQIRILKVLSEAEEPMTRKEMSTVSQVRTNAMDLYIGCIDPERRNRAEESTGVTSLLSLMYISVEKKFSHKSKRILTYYRITELGRKVLVDNCY